MPLGDNDIASGVFFSDFADVVTFGNQTTMGNFDAPGKDAIFGDKSVSDAEYRVEIGALSLNPFPKSADKTGDVVGIRGSLFRVRSANPLDDGATVELKLRKL